MIRKALLSDLEKINVLGEKLHHNFAKLFHIETEIENSSALVLVNEQCCVVIGFLYALNGIDSIDLLSIVVDESSRGQKCGLALLSYLLENYGHDKEIFLEVAVDNLVAFSLYKNVGFEVVHVRKGYYNGVDAYLMKRGTK